MLSQFSWSSIRWALDLEILDFANFESFDKLNRESKSFDKLNRESNPGPSVKLTYERPGSGFNSTGEMTSLNVS